VSQVSGLQSIHVRPGHPDFLDLPWHEPLEKWHGLTDRRVEVQRGLSRHEVVFLGYGQAIYAFKELPPSGALREFDLLRGLEEHRLPAVLAAGHARVRTGDEESSDLCIVEAGKDTTKQFAVSLWQAQGKAIIHKAIYLVEVYENEDQVPSDSSAQITA